MKIFTMAKVTSTKYTGAQTAMRTFFGSTQYLKLTIMDLLKCNEMLFTHF